MNKLRLPLTCFFILLAAVVFVMVVSKEKVGSVAQGIDSGEGIVGEKLVSSASDQGRLGRKRSAGNSKLSTDQAFDFVQDKMSVAFGYSHPFSGRHKKSFDFQKRKMLGSGLRFLTDNRNEMGLTELDLKSTVLKDGYTTAHNGVTHLYLRQLHKGIEVWNGDINLNLNRNGEVFHYGDRFVRNLANQVNREAPVFQPDLAIEFAAKHLNVPLTQKLSVVKDWGGEDQERLYTDGGISLQDIPVKLVYYSKRGEPSATLAWNLVIRMNDNQACWDMCIDAETGKVLEKANWVFGFQYRVVQLPMAAPNDPGNSSPGNDSRLLLSDPQDLNASPFGWHDDNGAAGNEYLDTRGNNVWAQEDADADNAGGYRPSGGTLGVFDFDSPIDFITAAPTDYRDSDITNLFYWNNICHDVFWHYGFDEVSGNFQANNYGNGGAAGDHVEADALDGSGTNNANFYTPPDGSNPRMQMFEFTSTVPRRSSSLDNLIIVHEYAHGVSTRLTGGPNNSSCLTGSQSGGMGEGWGDWLGIALTAKVTDTRAVPRPVGTYVLGQDAVSGGGIRPAPYSSDMTVNSLTYGSLVGGGLSIPHGYGSAWCTMLWDLYWDFVDAYGFDTDLYNGTGGNNIVLQLVMDGMKMQPCDPSFTDARDAILAADTANNGGANHDMIWASFARRGLGFSASDDEGGSNPTEAFDIADDLRLDSIDGLASSGPAGGPFFPSSKVYVLTNLGTSPISWTASKTETWFDVSPAAGNIAVGGNVTVTVAFNAEADALGSGYYTDTIEFTNVSSARVQNRSVNLRIDIDDLTEIFEGNDNDLEQLMLTFTPDAGGYDVCRNTITEFPSPVGTNTLLLSDDDNTEVAFTGGKEFPFYGSNYTSVFVGSNGYVTFGSGDRGYTSTLDAHFSMPRISAILADFNPTTGTSAITWSQLTDRMVITYQDIQPFGGGNPSSWQIELFFDGKIRMSWLTVGVTGGVAGISGGTGTPVGFIESDLTEYPVCPPPDMLIVSPSSGVSIEGVVGGPFSPTGSTFQLENTDVNSIGWTASISETWAAISSSGGTLSSGNITSLDMSLTAQAQNLAVGSYTAILTITNTQTGYTHERNIVLRVKDQLEVTPQEGFLARGPEGGPFDIVCKTYTLSNLASNTVNWTVSESADWLSASVSGGALLEGGSTTVDMCLTASADSLPIGIYRTTVTFTNVESSAVTSMEVVLRVGDYSTEQFEGSDVFDLANSQLIFSQAEGLGYSVCHDAIAELPWDVTNAIELPLSDDDNEQIILAGGATINFYGVSYGNLFIGSNGYLTFGQGDTDLSEQLSDHFDLPRISALFDDLNPASGNGKVYWQQLSDRVVVTYEKVSEFGYTTANDFQIEVFFTGDIRISYLGIASRDSIVGVSDGNGIPADFIETDFSASPNCEQVVTIESSDLLAKEYELSDTALLKVTRAGPTIEPLEVFFNTGGTAVLGLDYAISVSGVSLTIPAGDSITNVVVSAIDDQMAEGNEIVAFNLSANSSYSLTGNTSLNVTIEDHLIDAWRFDQYGGNPIGSGDMEDSDGDGYVTLMEYALGMDPNVANKNPMLLNLENDGGIDYLTLTYTRDTSLIDVEYQIETSEDLTADSWSEIGVTEVILSTSGTLETCKARVTLETARKFLRLRVNRIR